MKVMYISHRFETNACATTHLSALRSLYGEANVFIVDLQTDVEIIKTSNKISFGRMSRVDKVKRLLEGNSWYLTNIRIRKICNLIQENEISSVFIDESIFGKLVKAIKKSSPDVKVISFYHDVAQDLYKYWAKTKGIKFLPEMKAGILGERLTQKYSDVNLVLNRRDRNQFFKYFKRYPEGELATSVRVPELDRVVDDKFTFEEGKKYLLFVGSLYRPNIDGLEWFVRNVFYEICGEYELVVVGRGLESLRDSYRDCERVTIVGGVDSLAPYYNNAEVVIAPIFDGGGMKQKTAEALAYGKLFVGTTESLQGYDSAFDCRDDKLSLINICDTKEEFIKVFKKLEDYDIKKYYDCLNTIFKENYSLEAVKKELSKWF